MSVETLTEQIAEASVNYQASDAARKELGLKIFVPIIGPLAAGKTALIETAPQLDHDFGQVKGFMTRPHRPHESQDRYEFLPRDEPTLRTLLAQIEAGELANFIVHAQTRHIYGTRPSSYQGLLVMLETMPTGLGQLERLGFKDSRPVGVTAPPKLWEARMGQRLSRRATEQVDARIKEGIINIETALDLGSKVLWLINDARPITQVAREMISLVRGTQEPDPAARKAAAKLLAHMRELQLSA